MRNTPDFICKKQKQKTSIISANKYIYHMERAEGVTFEKWDEARCDAEQDVSNIMFERGYALEEYEEQRLHLIIEEACRKCGMNYYRRKR